MGDAKLRVSKMPQVGHIVRDAIASASCDMILPLPFFFLDRLRLVFLSFIL